MLSQRKQHHRGQHFSTLVIGVGICVLHLWWEEMRRAPWLCCIILEPTTAVLGGVRYMVWSTCVVLLHTTKPTESEKRSQTKVGEGTVATAGVMEFGTGEG